MILMEQIMLIILFINLILSKKDQKRLIFLINFFSKKINIKNFSEKNLIKFFILMERSINRYY